jgi:drug/metabolite transporter (DMT)-like permease
VTLIDLILFILLAAVWGSSFIFMRFLAPVLGPTATACARTLIAGLFLTGIFAALRLKMDWRRNFRHYLVVGILNSGLPFALYSFAALRLPASIPAIVNAMTPLWGAVFSAALLGDPLTRRKLLGLGLGVSGVALIALRGTGLGSIPDPLGIAACVLATVCYGFSGSYIKRWAKDVPARQMTAASLSLAGLALLPFAALTLPAAGSIPASVWLIAAGFALLCSAFAYLVYFRLIAAAGVTVALSVTLVVPVFAFLWGFLFLGERIHPAAVAGTALVVLGTALVIRRGSVGK